jgi:hypothetical protein
MPRRRDRQHKRTKIIWWLLLFMTASFLGTLLLRSPVPAVVCCVAAVMPFAGRMETRKGAGWLGFGLGLAGGLAAMFAMMNILTRVPVELPPEENPAAETTDSEPSAPDADTAPARDAAAPGDGPTVDADAAEDTPPATTTEAAPEASPTEPAEDAADDTGDQPAADDATDEQSEPRIVYEHKRLPADELGLLALVTVGTTVPFGVLVALLYHTLAARRRKRLDAEWEVFRDEG